MGCNCNKRRATAKAAANDAKTAQPPTRGGNPGAGTSGKAATSAARSGTGATQTFAYEPPTGRTQTYGSRLEAEAARVRAGYVGRVRPL
jgi:hypothetical protein